MILKFLPISVALICPHLSSENCNCRKPNTGLIRNFRNLFPHNHLKELYIGDQISDQKCSEDLDIPFIMVKDSLSINNKIEAALDKYL